MLEDVDAVDRRVPLLLLRQFEAFCKMLHLACSMPSDVVAGAMKIDV